MKGFMVGNAVTNWDWDGDASLVKLAFYFNLYPPQFKKLLKENDCTFNYLDAGVEPNAICGDIFEKF
jgi:hypothetical protein